MAYSCKERKKEKEKQFELDRKEQIRRMRQLQFEKEEEERTLCCILENYQTDKGVIVPEPLRPFVGTDFIPYVTQLLPGYIKPKEEKKKEGKGKKKEEK